MKKILTIAIVFAATFTSYSQSLGHKDLAVLFSQDDRNGSARFAAMSGAFGALGGDISAININPAGIAVYNNSSFSGTINSRNSDITSNYYGDLKASQDQFLNLSQIGAVLVFKTAYNSKWNKFAIGFNHRITKDFSDSFSARGNSGIATFTEFPLDNNTHRLNYNIADEQIFRNNYNGEISELNIAFSSVYQNKTYLGGAINFYDLNFSQQSTLTEFNSDTNGNELDANFYQENFTTGTGISVNLGFIHKAHKNFRLGASYQTSTLFFNREETNIANNDGFYGDTEISVTNDRYNIYDNTAGGFFPAENIEYRLKTPSKLTASAAFIFGKNGLLSFDYSNKFYKNTKIYTSGFEIKNQFFQNNLRNTHSYNIGTEWRFERFSVRGGYFFEQNPDTFAINSDNLEGCSFGAGYNFGNFKLDFSFSNNNRTAPYNFYSNAKVNAAELQIDNRTFTATFTLNL